MNRLVAYLIAAVLAAGQVGAVTLAECDRTTHVSHGGETGHRDFGAGRVGFAEWWSQEGVFTDLVIADCGSGDFLRTRVREDSISDRWFDRTDDAVAIIMTEMEAAPALFSFDRLARSLERVGRDMEIASTDAETCACAALYPELRGDKTPYEEAG